MSKKILETKRLILEELDEKHFDDLYKLLSNKKVQKYFPKTLDEKESKEFLNKVKKKYHDDGFSFWAVIRIEDKRFIGICGLLKQIMDENEEVEVAYRIIDIYWGNGFGLKQLRVV
ncbi:MAG: hypothetical protein SCARUB_04137 [Candidatus Scalindua rubra]|uniref:N-acetyltransferase domain-containing protein n=1 Tax=Candidatus Scalindua rubra TaxID=1872076 RepID=A0A1E3X5B3_9BACT|nr:MAG: hypothetical protein SCARUB_04137 [Candidatus Scalindua rubra]